MENYVETSPEKKLNIAWATFMVQGYHEIALKNVVGRTAQERIDYNLAHYEQDKWEKILSAERTR